MRPNVVAAPTRLLGKIVEIEALWLAIFIVRYHQVRARLRLHARILTFAELPLSFALCFLGPFLLPGSLLLSLRECGTRASCQWVFVS